MTRSARTPDPARRRRWLVWTVVSVAVFLGLVVGGPWVYARYLAPPTPDPLTLSSPVSDESLAEEARLDDVDGTWEVVEGSEAGYRLGEVLSGQEVTVVGRTDRVTGTVVVDDGVLTEAEVVVDVASVTTDESARDAYFRRALDTSAHPEATFVLAEPVDVSAVTTATGSVTVQAQGVVAFHGVSRPMAATLEVQVVPEGVEVVGSLPVTLADFDLVAPDLGFVTVDPTGALELLLVLQR